MTFELCRTDASTYSSDIADSCCKLQTLQAFTRGNIYLWYTDDQLGDCNGLQLSRTQPLGVNFIYILLGIHIMSIN